jgi:DedD protein
MSEQKDTEIVLGTGKLLAIFFALVAICGTFFGLGYSLGRTSSPMALQSGPTTLVSGPGAKPVAGVTLTTPAPVVTPPPDASEKSDPQPDSSASAANSQTVADTAAAQTSTAPADTEPKRVPPPELQGGAITVQVAAVTKEEDAQALVAALRKKNYPVFVSPNASADSLYHVQVGPFAEMKDAEAMKSKLAGDGYNAIVKR